MRIGIDIREFESGKSTGIGRYLRHFLRYAKENDKENTYVLFGNQNTDFVPLNENQKLHRINHALTIVWDQILLPKALKKEKVDVFLTPYFKAPVFMPCKLVVIINDLIPLMTPQSGASSSFAKRLYFRWGTKMASMSADKLITISVHTKADLIRIFHVPENKVKVVHLAVDPAYHKVESAPGNKSALEGIHRQYILHIGHFKAHKNISRLMEAYSLLPEPLKEQYQLVLAAKKNGLYPQLMEQVQELRIKENVVFTDYVPEEKLPELYSQASLLVLPSLYEGFGLPALEAMACQTPVAVSNVSSLPEVVGDAGVCFNPQSQEDIARAMEAVLTDEKLRSSLIQKGLKRVSEFTIEKMGAMIHEILIHC